VRKFVTADLQANRARPIGPARSGEDPSPAGEPLTFPERNDGSSLHRRVTALRTPIKL